MDTISRLGRIASLAIIFGLAFVSAASAARVAAIHEPSALVFGISSMLFTIAGIWTLVRGQAGLLQAAGVAASLYAIAFVLVRTDVANSAGWVNAGLYRALTAEGLLIWMVLLGGAFALSRLSRDCAR